MPPDPIPLPMARQACAIARLSDQQFQKRLGA